MIRYATSDGTWSATSDVVVGIARRELTVDLGRLGREPDPGGLRSTPVVTVPSSLSAVVHAGSLRAGKNPTILFLPAGAPALAGQLLLAATDRVEVLVVEDGGPDALVAARVLGGRPIATLPLDDPVALAELFGSPTVDVHLAVPSAGDGDRDLARAAIAPYEPERIHHLVDVDPRPAFDELGREIARATPRERAAAAAGVLAGRLAAGNRRWRA